MELPLMSRQQNPAAWQHGQWTNLCRGQYAIASITSCIVHKYLFSSNILSTLPTPACDPVPRSRPRCRRAYVCRYRWQLTQNTPRLRSSSYSQSLESYIVRMRLALHGRDGGGRWKSAPVRVLMAWATPQCPPSAASPQQRILPQTALAHDALPIDAQ